MAHAGAAAAVDRGPAPRSNVRELYHGTSIEAAMEIQRGGFRVDLSGSNAGAMLGEGVYCTTTLEKALNYAKGLPGNANPHGGVVFRMEVDLGRCFAVTSSDRAERTLWHRFGYDSCWSAAGLNGVNEENCVRDQTRIKIQDAILGNTGDARRAGFEVRKIGTSRQVVRIGTMTMQECVQHVLSRVAEADTATLLTLGLDTDYHARLREHLRTAVAQAAAAALACDKYFVGPCIGMRNCLDYDPGA